MQQGNRAEQSKWRPSIYRGSGRYMQIYAKSSDVTKPSVSPISNTWGDEAGKSPLRCHSRCEGSKSTTKDNYIHILIKTFMLNHTQDVIFLYMHWHQQGHCESCIYAALWWAMEASPATACGCAPLVMTGGRGLWESSGDSGLSDCSRCCQPIVFSSSASPSCSVLPTSL